MSGLQAPSNSSFLQSFLLYSLHQSPTIANISWACRLSFSLSELISLVYRKQPIVTVNVHAAMYLLDSGHRFFDIRSKEEFAEAHIKNSLHVPYFVITPQGKMKNPRFVDEVSAVCSKNDHVVVGCQTGTGSLSAHIDLLNADFKRVKSLGGGFNAWWTMALMCKRRRMNHREFEDI